MSNGLISKFKNWMTEDDDYYDDEEIDAELEENEEDMVGNDMTSIKSSAKASATSKVVNLHTTSSKNSLLYNYCYSG